MIKRNESISHENPFSSPGPDSICSGKHLQHLHHMENTLTRADSLFDEAEAIEKGVTLSLILPVYNVKKSLPAIIRALINMPIDKELLLVDDGSTDGTTALASELAEEHDALSLLRHDRNRGKGAALRTGLRAASGSVVVVLDDKLSYNPDDILMLIKPIIANCCDVIYGSYNLLPELGSGFRLVRLSNYILTAFSNFCTGQNLSGCESSIKAFRRSAIEDITIRQNRYGVEAELIAKLSYRGQNIYEMPLSSQGAVKKQGFWKTCQSAWFILRHTVGC